MTASGSASGSSSIAPATRTGPRVVQPMDGQFPAVLVDPDAREVRGGRQGAATEFDVVKPVRQTGAPRCFRDSNGGNDSYGRRHRNPGWDMLSDALVRV